MADRYHLARVFDEAGLVVDRKNGEMATLGVIIQSATMTTGMGASQDAQKHFQTLIKGLAGE